MSCLAIVPPTLPSAPPVPPTKPDDEITTASSDADGDGFSDNVESAVKTNPFRRCGTSAWPPDWNNDTFSDISDLAQWAEDFGQAIPPAGIPGSLGGRARYDLAPDPPDGYIDISDLVRIGPLFSARCFIIDAEADGNALSPFDGYWDHFLGAHPPTHETSQIECDPMGCFGPGDWAVDYFAPAGTPIRFYGSSDCCTGSYAVVARVDAVSPTDCAGGGTAGSTVFVDLHKNGSWKGWVGYAHVDNVQVSVGQQVFDGTILGYTRPPLPFPATPVPCYVVNNDNGVHVHVEMYDQKLSPPSGYACYVNYRSNTHVPFHQLLGTVGRGLPTVQPCY